MTPSNANTSGLEVVGWRFRFIGPKGAKWTVQKNKPAWYRDDQDTILEPLVTAASAQARIAELEAENDVMKVEVIGLRAAIFGSHEYDPALRHANFIEMARATEDGRLGALNRATAAEAQVDKLARALRLARPYVADLPIVGDADLAIIDAALQQETQP